MAGIAQHVKDGVIRPTWFENYLFTNLISNRKSTCILPISKFVKVPKHKKSFFKIHFFKRNKQLGILLLGYLSTYSVVQFRLLLEIRLSYIIF